MLERLLSDVSPEVGRALDAALEAIDIEGIETFIGPDSDMRYRFDA